MAAIFSITFPIYAAIAVGYGAVRLGAFPRDGVRTMGAYVLKIAFPALLFRAIATRDFSEVVELPYLLAACAGGIASGVVMYLWLSATGVSKSRRAVAVMGSTCPNSGFVGYPVMLLTFPALAGVILTLNVIVESLVLIPIALTLMELAREGEHTRALRKTLSAILGAVKQPFVITLILAALVSFSGMALPAAFDRFLGLVGASAAPVALFAIGGSLVGVPFKGNRAVAVQITLAKLVLHPAMVAVMVWLLAMAGIGFANPDLRVAVILSAAMPMFSIYPIFAQELGHEGMASIALVLATVSAFVTLNVLLVLLT